MLFKCPVCEVQRKEIEYLKELVNSLFLRLDMPIVEKGQMIEDYKEEPEAKLSKDGLPAPDVYDD